MPEKVTDTHHRAHRFALSVVATPIKPLYIEDGYKEIKCDKLVGGHHTDEQILCEAAVHIAYRLMK